MNQISPVHQTRLCYWLVRVAAFTGVMLSVAAPVSAQSYGANPDSSLRGDRWDPVRTVIKGAIDSKATASISVAVAHRGKIIWEEGFGYADKERQIPASPSVPYSLASLSKPFTATGVMTLVEQGKVRLERPVNDYLGTVKLRGFAGPAEGATVGRVLSHTAGLPAAYHFFYETINPVVPPIDTTIARYGILVSPPGSTYEYSNLGYGILGHVIERVSSRQYAQYMRDAVFAPLGLTNTFVEADSGRSPAATRYDANLKPIAPYDVSHPGASSVWSSAHDVARFGMFHLKNHLKDQKRILNDATLDFMKQAQTPDTLQGRYGVGWIVIPDDNGYPVVAHAGGMPGVGAVLVLYPTADLAITVLTNGEGFIPGFLVGGIAGIVLPKYAATQKAREASESEVEAPTSTTPAAPASGLIGEWKGVVRTYSDSVSLVLTVKTDGDVHVALGDELPTVLSSAEFDAAGLTGVFNGQIPTKDAEGFTRVVLRLQIRGDRLNGMARAQNVGPVLIGGLPSYAELKKTAP